MLLLMAGGCYQDDEPATEDEVLLQIGDAMPCFEVTTLEGELVSPATLVGEETVIVFFNTSCPDCQRELPEIQREADANPAVSYICIAREETAETIIPFWKENHLTMAVAPQPDRKVYSLFARTGIPRQFHFDKSGCYTGE